MIIVSIMSLSFIVVVMCRTNCGGGGGDNEADVPYG